jgi:lycopene cyclase domain-containing protein
MTYTELALVAVAVTGLIDTVIARTFLITRRVFWVSYAIILVFQLITNAVLTGYQIVRYDGDSIVGSARVQFIGDGRVAFAPIEDLFFGFALVTLTLVGWVWWGRRGVQREPMSGPPRWRE